MPVSGPSGIGEMCIILIQQADLCVLLQYVDISWSFILSPPPRKTPYLSYGGIQAAFLYTIPSTGIKSSVSVLDSQHLFE